MTNTIPSRTSTSWVPDGQAVVYCENSFSTTTGKTAHGLVRRTRRYEVLSVIDSSCAGTDAAFLLDGVARDIPIVASLEEAFRVAQKKSKTLTHFVVGLAPDGGRLDPPTRLAEIAAIHAGLNVDAGLHDFLADDREIAELAAARGVRLRDVRRTPPRSELHPFTGKIAEVKSLKIAVLGTDSAVGKRTTCWCIVDGLEALGHSVELVGTGQTAWLQGARYSLRLDSLINDFVAGEIEHAVWSAWKETACDVVVVEGQGSLLHPAYPGGFEIIAAAKPDLIVLQHAPARTEYDGFPGQTLDPLHKQIQALELISGRRVSAITINHEHLTDEAIEQACQEIQASTGILTTDVLRHGPGRLAELLAKSVSAGSRA